LSGGSKVIIVLTGANDFLIKQAADNYVAKFAHDYGEHGIERVSGDELEISKLPELLLGASLFAPKRLVVIKELSKNKPAWDSLGEWLEKTPEETTLILIELAPDKRTKTYKLLQKHSDVQNFEQLSEQQLTAWVKSSLKTQGCDLDLGIARHIVERVGVDQWKLCTEVQKLASSNMPITKDLINDLVEASPQSTVFDLLDAVLEKSVQKMHNMLDQISISEDPYRFFGLLVSQIYALTAVSMAKQKSADQIAKEAAIHPFVVRKTQTLVRNITEAEVKKIVQNISRCDDQIKSSGVDPWIILRQCLGKIATR
jgi:DNA polymerase III delta subunit